MEHSSDSTINNRLNIDAISNWLKMIQETVPPAVWSKAVAHLKTTHFNLSTSADGEEITLYLDIPGRPVSNKVNLWISDQDAFCQCKEQRFDDLCVHIIGSLMYLKGLSENKRSNPSQMNQKLIQYSLSIQKNSATQNVLCLTRLLGQQVLTETLSSYISKGIVTALKDDSRLESFLAQQIGKIRPPYAIPASAIGGLFPLFKEFSEQGRLLLDNQKLLISTFPYKPKLSLSRGIQNSMLKLDFVSELEKPLKSTFFDQPICLITTQQSLTLYPLVSLDAFVSTNVVGIPAEVLIKRSQLDLLSKLPILVSADKPEAFQNWILTSLPEIQKNFSLSIDTLLPEGVRLKPRIRFESQKDSNSNDAAIYFLALIEYFSEKEQISAVIHENGEIEHQSTFQNSPYFLIRDYTAEQELMKLLTQEFHLKLGSPTRVAGTDAIQLLKSIENFSKERSSVAINLTKTLKVRSALEPIIQTDGKIGFFSKNAKKGALPDFFDLTTVLDAYERGQSWFSVSSLSHEYTEIPKEFLEKNLALIKLFSNPSKLQELNEQQKRKAISEVVSEFGKNDEIAAGVEERKEWFDNWRKVSSQLNLSSTKKIRIKLPDKTASILRSYQKEAITVFSEFRQLGLAGLLADDMGLGKTLQALCLLEKSPDQGPHLISCPTSVLGSWQSQIKEFRPDLTVCSYYGTHRKLNTNVDVILIPHSLIRNDSALLSTMKFSTFILDEAHNIKNHQSGIAQSVFQIQAAFRVALTGTPVENRAQDLWSIFNFLLPGYLPELKEFNSAMNAGTMQGEQNGEIDYITSTRARIQKKVAPFIIRRTKQLVAPELPQKTEMTLNVLLNDQEKEVYQSLLLTVRQEIQERLEEISTIGLLEMLLRLRQTCCHLSLIPQLQNSISPSFQSSKLTILLEKLDEVLSEGHKCLIFSQWVSFLNIVEKELVNNKISFSRIDGSTTKRQEIIDEFQSPNGPSVMLLSLKAGGVGITLTEADHVFLLDPWWNPAVENQATDRTHRIGQTKPVFVYRLIAQDTIESKMTELQKTKLQIAEQLVENKETQQLSSLTRDDILSIINS